MCGRYTLTGDVDRYAQYFGVDEIRTESLQPSYNVAPTDPVYAIVEADRERRLGTLRWGLLPFWAEDRRAIHINARAETIATKPAFRDAFRERRCVIPADGFYEWERRPEGKLPHYIRLRSGQPMGFAGIWSRWRDPVSGERVTTCAIVTGGPNEVVEPLHNRMPVVLDPSQWEMWLEPEGTDTDALLAMLTPAPAETMTTHAVSSLVNSVENNLPELIAPLPERGTA